MKFPRNARIFRGHLDAAPYAAVFFLLVLFVLMGSVVCTPPGVKLDLPRTEDLPGTDQPTVAVAIDSTGRLYFRSQMIERAQLSECLRAAARNAPEPLTLIVQADKAVPYDSIIQLALLARDAGIHEALLATLPRIIEAPAIAKPPS